MRNLSLEEVKKIQVEMLVDFDTFCRKNNITYFLAYGTLLGAIRHKGYIPWDDDVDVMVPRTEIKKVVKSYHSDRYAIIDTSNDSAYEFPHPRMIDKKTIKKAGKTYTYGVCIDIYVIDGIPTINSERIIYKENVRKLRSKRLFLIKARNFLRKYIPVKSLPFLHYLTRRHEEELAAYPYSSAELVHVFDIDAKPMKKEIFGGKEVVDFEGHKFFAPIGWDEFLKNSYGNYMQLPPEEQRHPYHGSENYYITD